jgi:hypothetical protein
MSDQINESVKKLPKRRGDALPEHGFGLAVDGKIKSQYDTSEAATKAGLAIKRSFPKVQVTVFDAIEGTRTLVELPTESAKA